MNEKFNHNGKEFEIRTATIADKHCVKVFHNGAQVSVEYSATIDVGFDFFRQNQQKIIDHLKGAAKSDIENGIFLEY